MKKKNEKSVINEEAHPLNELLKLAQKGKVRQWTSVQEIAEFENRLKSIESCYMQAYEKFLAVAAKVKQYQREWHGEEGV